tara:strand:+ start:1540 stop:1866 length:327 start_codon:yes stop_codon:yes gene_type:complete
MAQALHAKDMCKKIYIPWQEVAEHLIIVTSFSEEAEENYFVLYHKLPQAKIWFFSLQAVQSYWDSGLQQMLLCKGEFFSKYMMWARSRVWQSNDFQEQRRTLKKQWYL